MKTVINRVTFQLVTTKKGQDITVVIKTMPDNET